MKKGMVIISMLCAASAAWATLVTDDFNRPDQDYTSDTSLIGAHWKQPGTTNTWSIGNGGVYSYVKERPGFLYNDEVETTSGNGNSFALSLDVALRHSLPIWAGITWNYQNVTDQYILRMKETYDDWQLLSNNNHLHVIASGHAPEVFAADTYYTLSITSANAYQFDYSIVRTSDSAVFASGSATDGSSLYTGGYAGFYQDTTGGAHAKFDNFSLEAIPEPATLGLMGFVGAAAFVIRKRFMI